MREIFAALQGRFAKLDGFNEAGFFGEVPADSLLRKRIRVTPSLGGKFCKLVLFRSRFRFSSQTPSPKRLLLAQS